MPSVDTPGDPKQSRPGREYTARGRGEDLEPAVIALLVCYGLAILYANVALVAGL